MIECKRGMCKSEEKQKTEKETESFRISTFALCRFSDFTSMCL